MNEQIRLAWGQYWKAIAEGDTPRADKWKGIAERMQANGCASASTHRMLATIDPSSK